MVSSLKVYQRKLINLCKNKFKVSVMPSSDDSQLNSNIRTLLCSENVMIVNDDMTLQHQTLVLSIYMSLLSEFHLSPKILSFGDKLVLCGLYNTQFNKKKAATLYNLFKNEIKNMMSIEVTINELDIVAGIYGLNSTYTRRLQELADSSTLKMSVDTINIAIELNMLDKKSAKLFTPERRLNMINYKPHSGLLTNMDFALIVIRYISNSKFLNIVENENCYNAPMLIDDLTKKETITINGNDKIVVHTNLESFTPTNQNIYYVSMSYDCDSYRNFCNGVFAFDLSDAIKLASEFEFGIILVYIKDDASVYQDAFPTESITDVIVLPTTGKYNK